MTKSKTAPKAVQLKKAAPSDDAAIAREFKRLVNMSAKQIDAWLDHQESKDVGFKREARANPSAEGRPRRS